MFVILDIPGFKSYKFYCLKVLRIILKRFFLENLSYIFSQSIILHENIKIFMIKLLLLNGTKIKRNFQ
jgi:hypothetical protein